MRRRYRERGKREKQVKDGREKRKRVEYSDRTQRRVSAAGLRLRRGGEEESDGPYCRHTAIPRVEEGWKEGGVGKLAQRPDLGVAPSKGQGQQRCASTIKVL